MASVDQIRVGQVPALCVDACVLLNLYATSRVRELLLAQSRGLFVAQQVAGEALYVMRRSAHGELVRELVDLQPEVAVDLITVATLRGVEVEDYVRHAATLDDGEAATVAIAQHRSAVIATDDRAAISYVSRTLPDLRVLQTSDLIRHWATANNVPDSDVGRVLIDIQQCARFVPHESDTNHQWWRHVLDEAINVRDQI